MNPYEASRERLEQAVISLRAAKKDRDEAEAYLLKAEARWAAATRDLCQYETKPGIPLPQYRELAQAAGTEQKS